MFKKCSTETVILFLVSASMALGGFLLACSTPLPPQTPPNVVLIVMDTARRESLSSYGYRRPTTPNLDALADEFIRYSNAYSTSSWTIPAHASLFTGLYPIAHQSTQEQRPLNPNLITLAEILSASDYQTFGIAENSVLSTYNRFHQGFDEYYETWKIEDQDPNDNVAYGLFEQCVKERDPNKPFFAFLNFIEPHAPYDSSGKFRGRFISDRSIRLVHNWWKEFFLGQRTFSQAQLDHLQEEYDAEILYVDYWIDKMVNRLKKDRLWDNTLFIVVTDHGEAFGEHELMGHVFALYEYLIQAGTMIHYPEKLSPPEPAESGPVQLVDVFPTVLSTVGIDPNQYPSQGLNLAKEQPKPDRPVFTEYYYPDQVLSVFKKEDRDHPRLNRYKRKLRSVIVRNKKLIWADDGKHELYDLEQDPEESLNRIDDAAYREARAQLEAALEAAVTRYAQARLERGAEPEEEMDEATVQSLRHLGYVR